MSYSQILRRLSRVMKSTLNDVMDNFSQEASDLNDFDEALRKAARGKDAAGAGSDGQKGPSSSGQARPGGQGSGQRKSDSRHQEGRRKPGERDDAHYYSILGLTPDASAEQIRKTYRKLMGLYHPDRVGTLNADKQAAAAEKAKVINEAYQIIARRRGIR